MAGSLNIKSISRKVINSKKLEQEMHKRAEMKLQNAKNIMINEFESHPVSVEIAGGSGASNSSRTLGGYGNLFTFIGFPAGARPIAKALGLGADIVVVGRCTDPALALGPLINEFGWQENDWQQLAQGTMAGHLLECGAQVTGAYFADPGYKDVPDLAEVGFPIAEINSDGSIVITKAEKTGGIVSEQTVKEQLLYEIHDPENYFTADVILDISQVSVEQLAANRVRVSGANGKPYPSTLKATVSIEGGWMGEAEMTYAGPNALARAELAVEVLKKRCRNLGTIYPIRFDIL